MRTLLGFLRGLSTLHPSWQVWVGVLGAANALAPLFFLDRPEARWVLVAILLAAMLQLAIFRARGFVRLLGLSHLVPWTPLLPWLVERIPEAAPGTPFKYWLVTVVLLDLVSYGIDLADVLRYAAGDREPSVTVADVERPRAT